MLVCWRCGDNNPTRHFRITEIPYYNKCGALFHDDIHQREYCETCYNEEEKTREYEKKEYVRLKSKAMFERAVNTLERQDLDLYEYREAILSVGEQVEEFPEKYKSSPEIITAIILAENRISAKVNYKIDKYIVDFYIPEYKTILEVDGYMHKHRVDDDAVRDEELRKLLGDDWEIVRIPTKHIEEKAELIVDAMIQMKEEIQKIRKENYGLLPGWFSKRAKKTF